MLQPLERRLLLAVIPLNDDAAPAGLFDAGDRIYFAADDGTHGRELWTSDGTDAGTTMVKDIITGAVGSDPRDFVSFNNATYFVAQNNNADQQLWKTDGTAAGTQLVADIRTVAGRQAGVAQMKVANGKLFIAIGGSADYHALVVSDGTAEGTFKIRDFNPFHLVILGAVNGTTLLNANGDANNNELWRTDGTPAGTVLVKDINPGGARSEPGELFRDYVAVIDDEMYFGATVNNVRQF